MLAALDILQLLTPYLEHFPYGGTFLALFLAGWLIPLPEEPLLLFAGYVAYNQHLNVYLMIVMAMGGLLCGDLMIFGIGRRHGDWAFRLRLFRWLLPEERLARARRLFAEHGSKMAFFGRFIAGIRLVVFFTAGNLGVPVGTFIVYDFLAAMLTIPISVYLAHRFGGELEKAVKLAGEARWIVIAAISILALVMLIRTLRSRRIAAAAKEPGVTKSLEKAEHA